MLRRKMKQHGTMMSMSPSNSGGGVSPRAKMPSGTGYPKVPASNGGDGGRGDDTGSHVIIAPMPVVLTWGTILKFAASIVIPLLAGTSFAIYFFHKTNLHMEDPTVHLARGERRLLETKQEAKEARTKLETDIKNHFDLKTGQLQLNNEKQISKIGKQLQEEQKIHYRRLLREIKKAN